MKKFIAITILGLIWILFIPSKVFAATNYGDGTYGGGNYNVGDTPIPQTNSGTNTSSASAPNCGNTPPVGNAPWIYEANAVSSKEVTIRFTNWQTPIDHFTLAYGTSSSNYQYGVDNIGGKTTNSFSVSSLSPNTTYYFKVRAGNGCATGTWSNELSVHTPGLLNQNNIITDTKIDRIPIPSVQLPAKTGYAVNINVKNTKGQPVENATVTLHSIPQIIKTDKNGVASFTNVEPGNHLVQIAYNNYTGEQSINLTGDTKEFNITITIKAQNALFSPPVMLITGLLISIIIILVIILARRRGNSAGRVAVP